MLIDPWMTGRLTGSRTYLSTAVLQVNRVLIVPERRVAHHALLCLVCSCVFTVTCSRVFAVAEVARPGLACRLEVM